MYLITSANSKFSFYSCEQQVMLTESKVGATNKTVEFTFLAKSEGFASIVIAVYGSSLEVDSARVNVWVTKPAPVAAIS